MKSLNPDNHPEQQPVQAEEQHEEHTGSHLFFLTILGGITIAALLLLGVYKLGGSGPKKEVERLTGAKLLLEKGFVKYGEYAVCHAVSADRAAAEKDLLVETLKQNGLELPQGEAKHLDDCLQNTLTYEVQPQSASARSSRSARNHKAAKHHPTAHNRHARKRKKSVAG